MTAGNIERVTDQHYKIKSPNNNDLPISVKKQNPSAYRCFSAKQKPSEFNDKAIDTDWFVDSVGYSIVLKLRDGLRSKYRLKIENIETPEMFQLEFMSQVNELFYKRQKNLKRVLLEQFHEFLIHLEIKCGNDCHCKLGHPEVDLDKLEKAFE